MAKTSLDDHQIVSRPVAASMAAGLLVLLAIVIFGPHWLVAYDAASHVLTPADRVDAINKARTTILQLLAGLVVVAGTYATWRRLRINEEELRASRDGQITERYSRAIEHLGSEDLSVRVGGIYALERVARNSTVDRDAIVALLCTYVRGHAGWPPITEQAETSGELRSLAARASDVQAAVVSLSHLQEYAGIQEIALPRTDLRFGRFSKLSFHDFRMDHANLQKVRLRGSDVRRSIMVGCDLRRAQLQNADFREVDLREADLREVNLCGTNLDGAWLEGAQLADAVADELTRWPDGFDPVRAGVRWPDRTAGGSKP